MLAKARKHLSRKGKALLQNCKNIVSILSICSITEIKFQSRFRDGVKLWKIMSCKGLNARQMQMIALGGTIGVGLLWEQQVQLSGQVHLLFSHI